MTPWAAQYPPSCLRQHSPPQVSQLRVSVCLFKKLRGAIYKSQSTKEATCFVCIGDDDEEELITMVKKMTKKEKRIMMSKPPLVSWVWLLTY